MSWQTETDITWFRFQFLLVSMMIFSFRRTLFSTHQDCILSTRQDNGRKDFKIHLFIGRIKMFVISNPLPCLRFVEPNIFAN